MHHLNKHLKEVVLLSAGARDERRLLGRRNHRRHERPHREMLLLLQKNFINNSYPCNGITKRQNELYSQVCRFSRLSQGYALFSLVSCVINAW